MQKGEIFIDHQLNDLDRQMLVYIKKHETVTLEQITEHFKSPVAAERFETLINCKMITYVSSKPDGYGGYIKSSDYKITTNGLRYLEDYHENAFQSFKNGLIKFFAEILKPKF